MSYSLRNHVEASTNEISQSAGGQIQFDIDACARFANKACILIPSGGEVWPGEVFTYAAPSGKLYEVGFPFNGTWSTDAVRRHHGDPGTANLRTILDSQGRGSMVLDFAPGEIPPHRIGQTLRFSALLESAEDPGFPESATEAITIEIKL